MIDFNITSHTMEMLSQAAQRADDEAILAAVNRRLGTDFKSPRDPEVLRTLHGRCNRTVYPDGREIYALDGLPIIEFLPLETDFDSAVRSTKRTFRDYTVPDASERSTSA